MNPISGFRQPGIAPIGPGADPAAGAGFRDAIGRAVDAVDADQHRAAETSGSLVRGEEGSLVRALLAAEQADLSLRFALQVRNKIVEAYQDVLRMQV